MSRGRWRRRGRAPVEVAPFVAELFADAQVEAIAYRHDFIGTEHVLLALVKRDDDAGQGLRDLGLDVAGVREDVRRIVGQGPEPDALFDAVALAAIGVDLDAVRARMEATFGAGSLERARRRRGKCGAAAFGVSPRLKQALEAARGTAAEAHTDLSAAGIAISLGRQRGCVAAQILDSYHVSPDRLRAVLEG